MSSKKHHIVYVTTCLPTGRWYVGVHSTDNLNDGYLGSGVRLRRSVRKYGSDNHFRETLETFSSREEALELEKKIVDWDVVKNSDACLNLVPGGTGGDLISHHPDREYILARKDYSWMQEEDYKQKMREALKPKTLERLERLQERQKEMMEQRKAFGYRHSAETRQKISVNNGSRRSDVRAKISTALSGRTNAEHSARMKDKYSNIANHPRAKHFVLTAPDGRSYKFVGIEAVAAFCKSMLSLNLLMRNLGVFVAPKTKLQKVGKATVGWKLELDNEPS